MPIGPPKAHDVKIFDNEPPLGEDSFNSGVPSTSTANESLSILLYSPNLQIVASLDNTNSDVTSNYQTSISHGFTFSATQSISVTAEVGVNIEIFTAKISTTLALSFTEQWNTTSTKSMNFSCPPGKKAFVYQGTLMSRVMELDAATAQYKWFSAIGKALTQVLVTSKLPIGNAPGNPVTIKS